MKTLLILVFLLTGCTIAGLKEKSEPVATTVTGQPKALAECLLTTIDTLTNHQTRVDLRVLPNGEANIFSHIQAEFAVPVAVYEFRHAGQNTTTLTAWYEFRSDRARFDRISKALNECSKTI